MPSAALSHQTNNDFSSVSNGASNFGTFAPGFVALGAAITKGRSQMVQTPMAEAEKAGAQGSGVKEGNGLKRNRVQSGVVQTRTVQYQN